MDTLHDVCVLGSGLFGSAIATILARQGLRTLLIDDGIHPRFAIGESTISQTTVTWRAIARHFDVPELAALSRRDELAKHIGPVCGLKHNFGFVYNKEGRDYEEEETHQFGVPSVVGVEAHFYRQDVDAWVAQLAVAYGAEAWWGSRVTELEPGPRDVRIFTKNNREARARFVVDATGHASPIARQFGFREDPCTLKTHSRSYFTHMIGVKHLEDIVPGARALPYRWSQGTLHQVIPDGWMWIIPFDNFEGSTNPRCSVGVHVDPRAWPMDGRSAEAELADLGRRFPLIARQLADARAVRPWVSTPRIQYNSTRISGDRFVLASHAAGFIDALYSRGMANSTSAIFCIARRLLRARDEGSSEPPFSDLDAPHTRLIRDNDDLVHGSYVATRSYPMWNAWLRIWATFMGMRTLQTLVGLEKLKATGDASMLDGTLSWKERHPAVERYDEQIFRPAIALKERVAAGELDPLDAGRAIFELLQAHDLGPIANKASFPQNRYHGKQSAAELLAEARWFFQSPENVFKTFHSDFTRYAAQTATSRLNPSAKLSSIPRVAESLPETLYRSSRDLLGFIEHLALTYPFATIDLGTRRAILVSDLDRIDEIFVRKSGAFGRPRSLIDAFNAGPLPTGEFLMASVSWEHDERRRLLSPAFTPSALTSYGETIVSVQDETFDRWAAQGERVPVMTSMTSFTLEIAGLTLFGSRIGGEDKLRDAFEQWTADIDHHFRNPLPLPRSLPTPWNRRTQRAVRTIAEHLDACVAARRRAPDGERSDALGLLLSAQTEGTMLDPAVIRGAVLTLYLAGHDTTATALAWCLYLLGENPDALARLRAEADAILGDARPTYQDLKRLPFSLGVYKEALRLYPPTFAMVRESHRSVEIGGHTIPPGTLIIAPTYGIHRDPKNYPDPLRFDPDRWRGASVAPTGPFFPLGAGPFSCLGGQFAQMEGALVLSRLAQRFDVTFEGLSAVRPKPGFSLKPSPEFYARFSRRAG